MMMMMIWIYHAANIYIYNLGIRVSKDPNVVYLPVVIHSVQVVSDCSFVKVVFIFFLNVFVAQQVVVIIA